MSHPRYAVCLDEDDAGEGWGGVARTVGNVVEAEQKTGDELDHDQDHRHNAEITVAGGCVIRYPTIELGVDRIHELEALVEPIDDGRLQSHLFVAVDQPCYRLSTHWNSGSGAEIPH